MSRSLLSRCNLRSISTSACRNEYVYGLSSVQAALHARKRVHLDKLYIQKTIDRYIHLIFFFRVFYGASRKTKQKTSTRVSPILDACQQQNIPISQVDKGELNNMSANKPHQGVVLDGSPRIPITLQGMSKVDNGEYYGVTQKPVSFKTASDRPPVWVVLDEVQDPQNLGSILRTAYYLGVDGVLLCSKNSASLTPAVSKVSAGAMELMDVYATRNLVKFLQASSEEGWHIVGAAAMETSADYLHSSKVVDKPTMLVLGNEGVGLRYNVKRCCNQFISIPSVGDTKSDLVDSLNVGVAAGILISRLCL
ncbi:Alpha/beta knot methyltransferase [Zychaea mexicana]|uniref:Alpha/beta knot methyltransferase n=1 Tax=Zychaea mexicana TaxID=64656 RepID=UPI0022FF0F4A|nr:Alpha/beta knot methyltransferase [Zychaea mexicana]KAI9485073.1 Alpha/beta knot methyltransferase [Zychaea mexicana]